jgi:hypothetical protein
MNEPSVFNGPEVSTREEIGLYDSFYRLSLFLSVLTGISVFHLKPCDCLSTKFSPANLTLHFIVKPTILINVLSFAK